MFPLSRLFVFLIAAVILLTSQARAACLPPDVVVFYGNGIRTSAADAELDRSKLQAFLNRSLADPGQPTCDTPVRRAYNRTDGVVADLWEAAQQSLNTTPSLFARVLSWVASNDSIATYLATRIAAIDYQGYISAHAADLAAHLTAYREVLNSGGRIIVVAHSQGNLFANEAFSQLLREYGPSLLNRMRIVSVATPASSVAGAPLFAPSPHTTLEEDFIHQIPGALGFNTAAFPPFSCGFPWDCHALIGSYLDARGAVARARILQKIRDAFPTLALSGGTYSVRNVGIVGSVFLFDPVVANGMVETLTATGPSGWNNNNAMSVFRYQPVGISPHRSLFFSGVSPVSGNYRLEGSDGNPGLVGTTVIDATNALAPPEIAGIEATTTALTVRWSAVGAESFIVYLHDDPADSTPVREQLLTGSARFHTFTGLSLTPGQSYRAEVFSLSHDVVTPSPIGSQFNISSTGTVRFTVPVATSLFTLQIRTGNHQVGLRGEILPRAVSVLVVDQSGNPVGSVPVTFRITSGGGCLLSNDTAINCLPEITRTGISPSGAGVLWKLGPVVGTQTVEVTSPGVAAITFTATAIADVTSYVVDRVVGSGVIKGTIRTIGTLGALTANDLYDWDLRIDANGDGSFAPLFGSRRGDGNSTLNSFSPALEATQHALIFDFAMQHPSGLHTVLQFMTRDFQTVWQLQSGIPFHDESIGEAGVGGSYAVRPLQKQAIAAIQ